MKIIKLKRLVLGLVLSAFNSTLLLQTLQLVENSTCSSLLTMMLISVHHAPLILLMNIMMILYQSVLNVREYHSRMFARKIQIVSGTLKMTDAISLNINQEALAVI
jgi:hypothetical protein